MDSWRAHGGHKGGARLAGRLHPRLRAYSTIAIALLLVSLPSFFLGYQINYLKNSERPDARAPRDRGGGPALTLAALKHSSSSSNGGGSGSGSGDGRRGGGGRGGGGGGGAGSGAGSGVGGGVGHDLSLNLSALPAPGRRFIYVYDLGTEFTEDVLRARPAWYSTQYDAERHLAALLATGEAVRTVNPERASLFFVPAYGAWLLNTVYQDSENNMREAIEVTSKAWGTLLGRVRREFPYFNRTNGRDHFGILSMDHGRCTALTFLHPRAYGEMFFLTLNGDKWVRSTHANERRGFQAVTYNYGVPPVAGVPDIPCYLPDRDIVLPPAVKMALVSPFDHYRETIMLFRFAPGQHHGVPISHHGHQIRRELFDLYADKGIARWDIATKNEADSTADWTNAIFCAAPPGHSQWTSRPLKAILSGCIPVTFFREHDQPWEDLLDYHAFSLNVDPDDLASLRARVDALLADPERLRTMQRNVLAVREYFRWSGTLDSGVEAVTLNKLWERALVLDADMGRVARMKRQSP